ncbi:MAG TPA: aminotransferase class III-fold pyridoxal phosphate-dependent enzyme [Steroidobacteraceae bacterium]
MNKPWDSPSFSDHKRRVFAAAHEYLIPGRVEAFLGMGISLVIGRREGYRIWDVDGQELMDFHLNGGTFNVGHRNPVVLQALETALQTLDIGNHHFPSPARADLAQKLAAHTPGNLHYTVYAAGGSEAVDVAIKSARRYTGRRKIVAIASGYHGRTGLSGAAGDDTTAQYFASDYPDEFVKVPFDDLDAMRAALSANDVAAVILETIPATYGFPVPSDGYLPGVVRLCHEFGALYIADEVQTGLGRTGHLWGVDAWGVEPDILVTGKGLSGGLYPLAAAVLSKDVGRWLTDNGWGHVTTFGGAEPGCVVGSLVLDMCRAPEALAGARQTSDYLYAGLVEMRSRLGYLLDIRRKGLVMGLVFDAPTGGMQMMSALFRHGIWAIFAGYDHSVLQFKPGLFVDRAYCDEALARFEAALREAKGPR